jgi:homoserine kinase
VAGLVAGLYTKDIDLIARSMQDVIVEPVRSILIPDFYKLREIAMDNGALSFGISGSGPSVFTFTKNEDDARIINEKLQKHFLWLDTESIAYRSPINGMGPIILD